MADESNKKLNFNRLRKFRRPLQHRRDRSQFSQIAELDSLESCIAENSNTVENNDPTSCNPQLQYCYKAMTNYYLEDDYITRYLGRAYLKCPRQIINGFGKIFDNLVHHLEMKRGKTINLSIRESTDTINALNQILAYNNLVSQR